MQDCTRSGKTLAAAITQHIHGDVMIIFTPVTLRKDQSGLRVECQLVQSVSKKSIKIRLIRFVLSEVTHVSSPLESFSEIIGQPR